MRHRILFLAILGSTALLTVSGCFTSTPAPDDVLAINPRTGEMRHFSIVEDVPDGWEVCSDGECPSTLACSELDEPSCLAREDCAPIYGSESTDPGVPVYAGCTDAGPATCNPGSCGPPLGLATIICADGSLGGNTGRCLQNADGTCGWEIRECPMPCDCGPAPAIARICDDGSSGVMNCEVRSDGTCRWAFDCPTVTACTPEECAPAPGAPSMICADGSVAGPMCVRISPDACGWIFTTCPCDASSGMTCPPTCEPSSGADCPPCDATSCGPAPGALPRCSDGSSALVSCGPSADGTCGWSFSCPGSPPPRPPPACDPTTCGPRPGALPRCSDGSSADVSCVADSSGLCGWVISCPPGSGGGSGTPPGSGGGSGTPPGSGGGSGSTPGSGG